MIEGIVHSRSALRGKRDSIGARGGSVLRNPLNGKFTSQRGVETVLSVMRQTGQPTGAALGASQFVNVQFPSVVRKITLVKDADATSDKGARAAAREYRSRGLEVHFADPSSWVARGGDFNDLDQRDVNFSIGELDSLSFTGIRGEKRRLAALGVIAGASWEMVESAFLSL